jgi:Flp pilus assembly protein TadD
MAQLAMTYHGLGRDDQALRFIEQALPLVEQNAGPTHLAVANYLRLQAAILRRLERFDEADVAEARAREIEAPRGPTAE